MTEAQKKIMEVAGKMFFRFGIRSVSIDDISKELGMSKKTFYASFETKDELVTALLSDAVVRAQSKLESWLKDKSLSDALREFVAQQKAEKQDLRRVPQLVFDLQKYYPRQFEKYQQDMFHAQMTILRQYIQKGQEDGLVRLDIDAEMLAFLMAKLHADTTRDAQRMEEEGYNIPVFMNTALDVMIRGVLTEEGREMVLGN